MSLVLRLYSLPTFLTSILCGWHAPAVMKTLYPAKETTVATSRVPASPKPVDGVFTEDVVIDSTNNVWLRVFTPVQEKEPSVNEIALDSSGRSSNKKLPVIFYFHGGGFIAFTADVKSSDTFCRKIAKSCNAVILSITYRLAPKFPCPAAYDDCYKGIEWLRSPESRNHLPDAADISQSFLLGSSAGGNIVHFLGCRAAQNDISPIKLRGMIELQPFFGGEELTPAEVNLKPPFLDVALCHQSWSLFLPGHNRDHPYINVFGPNSPDISGLSLPPIAVVVGSLDILQDRQYSYVEKLREMGKEATLLNYTGAPHSFYYMDSEDSTLEKLKHDFMKDISGFVLSKKP